MNFKLTIIIPVYGVEDYIEACANSILSQMVDDVECVFVNDGTKDNSISILKNCIDQFPFYSRNIKLIEQDNQGLSMARNNGLKCAKGKYISYIDSDDILDPNYIKSILNIINKNDELDIIHFNALRENKNGRLEKFNLCEESKLCVVDDRYLLHHFKKNKWYAWLRVYNRKILNHNFFPKGYLFEDMLSVPLLYKPGMIVYEINQSLIIYKYRSTSITNVKITEKHLDSVNYAISLYRSYRDIIYFKHLYFCLIYLLFNFYFKLGFLRYRLFINDVKSNDLNYLINDKFMNDRRFKERWMIRFPLSYYFYKNRMGLRRYK